MAESEPFNQCTQEFDGDAGLHQSGELSCGAMSQTWIRERLKRGRGVERVEQRVLERETERDRERQRERERRERRRTRTRRLVVQIRSAALRRRRMMWRTPRRIPRRTEVEA